MHTSGAHCTAGTSPTPLTSTRSSSNADQRQALRHRRDGLTDAGAAALPGEPSCKATNFGEARGWRRPEAALRCRNRGHPVPGRLPVQPAWDDAGEHHPRTGGAACYGSDHTQNPASAKWRPARPPCTATIARSRRRNGPTQRSSARRLGRTRHSTLRSNGTPVDRLWRMHTATPCAAARVSPRLTQSWLPHPKICSTGLAIGDGAQPAYSDAFDLRSHGSLSAPLMLCISGQDALLGVE